jgi:Na+/proline symporter
MAATSGMNVYLASFLIPITVLTYTMLGGLKATFLASYIHTAIIFVGRVLFVSWTYVINDCPDTPMGEPPHPNPNPSPSPNPNPEPSSNLSLTRSLSLTLTLTLTRRDPRGAVQQHRLRL